MKQIYENTQMEVLPFTQEDIIVASIGPEEPDQGLINGGTGSGGTVDFKEMFPNL